MKGRILYVLSLTVLIPGPIAAQCLEFGAPRAFCTARDTNITSIGTGDFTVEAVVNGIQGNQDIHAPILSNRFQSISNRGLMFFIHAPWGPSTLPMLALQLNGTNYFFPNNGTFNAPVLDGTCHHVAVTRNQDTLVFFVDGTMIGDQVIPSWYSTAAQGSREVIGGDASNQFSFRGTMSHVRVWNRALSADELLAWGGVDIPGDTPGLLEYWKLNEGSGQFSYDQTGQVDMHLGYSPNTTNGDPTWTSACCGPDGPGTEAMSDPGARELRYDDIADRLIMGPGTVDVPTSITVFDAMGRMALQPRSVPFSGGDFALSDLATGFYLAVMEDGRHRETVRFFKQP